MGSHCALQIWLFLLLSAEPICSLSSQTLSDDLISTLGIATYGDAHLVNGASQVHLTRSHAPSFGLILRKAPFKLVKGNAARPASFSSDFTFSISPPGTGDALAFVLVGRDFASRFVGQGSLGLTGENRFLGVEFDTKIDGRVGDLNANHVGINVGSLESVRVSNVSALDLMINNGEKLRSWVDYEASSKRLEVRLGRFDENRPYNPILAYQVDLLKMWGSEDVFAGIVSTTGNSTQISSVHSWSFKLRLFPNWMHSLPADPRARGNGGGDNVAREIDQGGFWCLRLLAGLIFATGCGALASYIVLFVWAIFASRHNVFHTDCQLPSEGFKYEKITVITDKDAKGNGF